MIPAKYAHSGMASCRMSFPKYATLASEKPRIPKLPRFPRYTSFAYISKIRCLLKRCSSSSEIKASATFRRQLRSVERKRSEEHTSELQSRGHLVCRLLLE